MIRKRFRDLRKRSDGEQRKIDVRLSERYGSTEGKCIWYEDYTLGLFPPGKIHSMADNTPSASWNIPM